MKKRLTPAERIGYPFIAAIGYPLIMLFAALLYPLIIVGAIYISIKGEVTREDKGTTS